MFPVCVRVAVGKRIHLPYQADFSFLRGRVRTATESVSAATPRAAAVLPPVATVAGAVCAVVVCAGAQRADVRLAVTNAVAAYTGLGSDRIRVEKMK